MINLILASHLLLAALGPQDPPNPVQGPLDPIDQLGLETCENFSAGAEVAIVDAADYARWVDERAPEPKDDYETDELFRMREQLTWGAMLSESPVIVLAYDLKVTRENSRYDPESWMLTLNAPHERGCTPDRSGDCLLVGRVGYNERYLAIEGPTLHEPLLNISPRTARRLREQDNEHEITLFMVATPIRPYRSRSRQSAPDLFHVGVYCAVYYWEDEE